LGEPLDSTLVLLTRITAKWWSLFVVVRVMKD